MSIEKNVEKEKNRNLKKKCWQILFGRPFGNRVIRVGALALCLNTKNCYPRHFNIVRNSFFPFRSEKSRFKCLSFIDSFFITEFKFWALILKNFLFKIRWRISFMNSYHANYFQVVINMSRVPIELSLPLFVPPLYNFEISIFGWLTRIIWRHCILILRGSARQNARVFD